MSRGNRIFTSGAALPSIPTPSLTSRQLRAAYLVAFGEFVDGYDLLVMGVAMLFLRSDLRLSDTALGLMGAATFLGAAAGLVVFGDLSDRYGRRRIFVVNLYFFILFALASACVTAAWQLFIVRFMVGVSIGMEIPTSTAYLAEVAPAQQRGALLGSLLNVMWILGAIASIFCALPLVAWVGKEAWRYLVGFGAVPALLILLARRTLPESPRWLIARGRVDEARAALEHFGVPWDSLATKPADPARPSSYRDLLTGPHRARIALVTVIFVLNCLAGSITTICTPLVMKRVGALSMEQTLSFSALIWSVALVGTVISAFLVDRIARRTLCYVSTLSFVVLALILAVFGARSTVVLIGGFFLITLTTWSGIAVLTWVWASELFPTTLRGRSQGVASAGCRLAVAANIFAMPVALDTFGFGTYMAILALPMLAIALLAALNPVLDSGGMDLEEIAAEAAQQ